jgi:hypothetical protein
MSAARRLEAPRGGRTRADRYLVIREANPRPN